MGWSLINDDPENYPNGYWMHQDDNMAGVLQLGDMAYPTSWDWAMDVYIKLKDWKTEYLKTKNGREMLPTISTNWKAIEASLLCGEDVENFADAMIKMIQCREKLLSADKQRI